MSFGVSLAQPSRPGPAGHGPRRVPKREFGGLAGLERAVRARPVRDVMVGGRRVVEERHHRLEEPAAQSFRRAVKALVA